MNDAYTAGLFDGEGTVTLYRAKANQNRTPAVSVTSTTKPIMDWLKENYGGNVCKQKVYKEHHKQSWSWRCTGRKALDFLERIVPYMLETEKVRRATLILTEYENLTVRNGKYTPEQLAAKKDFEARFFM